LISFQKPWPRLKFKEAILQYSGLSADRLEDEKEMMELAGTLTPEAKPATYAKALDIIFDKMAKEKLFNRRLSSIRRKRFLPWPKPTVRIQPRLTVLSCW